MRKAYTFPTTKELQAKIDDIQQLKTSAIDKKAQIEEEKKAQPIPKLTNARQLTAGNDYFR